MENVGQKRFFDFDLAGGVFILTGGARGLGLAMAEGLVEAGGKGMVRENKFLDGIALIKHQSIA